MHFFKPDGYTGNNFKDRRNSRMIAQIVVEATISLLTSLLATLLVSYLQATVECASDRLMFPVQGVMKVSGFSLASSEQKKKKIQS